MTTLTCLTCKLTCSTEDISKHLSSTRHKQVRYDRLNETIECEECDDTNIHQLQILRFGFNDMTLLCQTCLNKEDKPSIQYSLSNGSFFKKIDQYYQFRDLECQICSNDRRLFVGNNNKDQLIACIKCLPQLQEAYPNVIFINEDDDFFLSELFGLTEFTPSGKKGKSKRGRGRMEKGGKRKKQLTPEQQKEAEERRDHYFNKLAQSKELKSGATVKAVGYEEPGKKNSKPNSSNGRLSSNNTPRNSKPNSARQSLNNTPRGSKPNSAQHSRSSTPTPEVKRGTVRTEGPPKFDKSKAGTNTGPKLGSKSDAKTGHKSGPKSEPKTRTESKPRTEPKPKSDKPKSEPKSEPTETTKSEKTKPTKSKHENKDGPNSKTSIEKSDQAKGSKFGPKPISATNKNIQTKGPGNKNGNKNGNRQANKVEKNNGKAKTPAAKAPIAKATEEKKPEFKLPAGIEKYTPSKEPKLQYEQMTPYFQEMSYNLFLEEKYSMSQSRNSYIESTESVLLWYEDHDKKSKHYKLEIELTQAFKDKFLDRNMQKFRKAPFSVDQTMFLILNDEIAWYGKVILAEATAPKSIRGRKKDEVLEIIVENFEWNYQKLPVNVNVKHLKILPASIPISRVFLAMSRIDNPRFISMLLGKQPIRQIEFNNYVKFSDENKFNQSQKVALQSVLNNSITVLQGPPGTGKTSTIHEIILQLLNNLNTYPILVVAASNIAIDNIAEKLLETHKNSLLRIVGNEKESEYNREHPLASICLHNKMYDMLPLAMKEALIKMRTSRSNEVSVNQYKKIRTKQFELSNILTAQARVIFTTSVTAGGNQLKSVKKIPVVIMDEATQSSEPVTLIPLSMPGVEKFVFVGDQNQLSSFTQVPNLSLSLFERVLMNGTYKKIHMLDTQYRMHPMISEFPRNKFYGGILKDGIGEQQRFIEGIDTPVQFWDTNHKHKEDRVKIRMREDNGYTYINEGEINYIIEVLTDLILAKKIERKDIGIITPYRGQRDLISKKLSENEVINPTKEDIVIEVDRDDIYNTSKPLTIHTVSDIMIASIDAFQGREKNFIVFSCVRSNEEQKIGFLNDSRRLNVALTRAKYGLVLIGDSKTLKTDELWKEYLDHLSSKNLINDKPVFEY